MDDSGRRLLCTRLTQEQMHTYGLVLDSHELPYIARKTSQGGTIWVDAAIHEKALDLIRQYEEENSLIPGEEVGEFPKWKVSYSAVWVAIILIACHVITNLDEKAGRVIDMYSASAVHIMNGEIHRAATALMLHGGLAHLAGNIAGLALFGTLVGTVFGAGVGWLMILLCGIFGNMITAALFQYGHVSIGASTAVFGALGILSAHQFWEKFRIPHQRKKAWLPLAGSLALLGFLGASADTDLTAHFFGFIAGIALGLIYTKEIQQYIKKKYQVYCALATVVILLAAWLQPLLAP